MPGRFIKLRDRDLCFLTLYRVSKYQSKIRNVTLNAANYIRYVHDIFVGWERTMLAFEISCIYNVFKTQT